MMAPSTVSPAAQPFDATDLTSYRALIARLPITLRPALNGQLADWETLFPYERRRVRDFLRGLASFSPPALDDLMLPLLALETKMGVARWDFNQSSDTMENASLLARSQFYSEWREQVRRIYTAADSAAATPQPHALPRLAVIILPASLPFDPSTVWKQWGDLGKPIALTGDPAKISELLLQAFSSPFPNLHGEADGGSSDLWLLDAESRLDDLAPNGLVASSLSWTALRPLRDHVLERVNTVSRSIAVTDRTLAAIRTEDMGALWPHKLLGRPQLQRFLIDLYLSGNGALIFSNAFVQWAASEAWRRARPRVIVARFGLRARPKPFTGIAIFENQQRISALPDVDDPQGSAIDASMLAKYILLSVQRYPEGAHTAFLAVSESTQSAYLCLPPSFKSVWNGVTQATVQQVADRLQQFLLKGMDP